MTNEWRAILAALANEDARKVYAEFVLGMPHPTPLSEKRRTKASTRLRNAGLLGASESGELTLATNAFANALELSAEPKREGIDRFLRGGRIERYPVRSSDRLEVLEWVATQALRPGEVLTEPQLNERLMAFDTDFAALRRYLVDAGLLLRTTSGTSYSRAETP